MPKIDRVDREVSICQKIDRTRPISEPDREVSICQK